MYPAETAGALAEIKRARSLAAAGELVDALGIYKKAIPVLLQHSGTLRKGSKQKKALLADVKAAIESAEELTAKISAAPKEDSSIDDAAAADRHSRSAKPAARNTTLTAAAAAAAIAGAKATPTAVGGRGGAIPSFSPSSSTVASSLASELMSPTGISLRVLGHRKVDENIVKYGIEVIARGDLALSILRLDKNEPDQRWIIEKRYSQFDQAFQALRRESARPSQKRQAHRHQNPCRSLHRPS